MMRAKMVIDTVTLTEHNEILKMRAVAKKDGYPSTGVDEDNSFAKWTPAATLEMMITNGDLFGKFKPGDKFYLDFTKAEE